MSDSYRPSSRKGTWRLILGAFAVLFALFMLFWWNSAMDVPKITIPSPVMPNPNAFDAYLSAGNLLLDDKKIGFAVSQKHGTGDKDDHVYTLADEEKLISENKATLTTLREGLDEPYLNPPVRSFSTVLPYYARFRALSRLIELEGNAKSQKGDWNGAADSYLDGIQMGEQVPHGSLLIGDLVGFAMQSISRHNVWPTAEHLNAKQARAAAKRMEKIAALHIHFADVMQEEKWAGQAGLLEFMNSRNASLSQLTGGQTSLPPASMQLFYLAYSKRRILNDYATYMDAEIARARQPYAAHVPATPIPNNPIMQILAPTFELAGLKDDANETQNHLLMLAFALHAYRAEHDAFPPSLNALVPGYLGRLPSDPFALNAPFKYKLKGSGYVLYSVGPDGTDDGGKPIDTGQSRNSNPNERYFVKPQSTGDIVAGVNRW